MIEAVVTDQSPIVLQWEPLAPLGESCIRAIMGQLTDRVVIIAGLPGRGRSDQELSLLPIARWAVIMEDGVLGMGDAAWYESIQPLLMERWRLELEARAVAVEATSGESLFDDDDDDD
jgi:hypothetical protein